MPREGNPEVVSEEGKSQDFTNKTEKGEGRDVNAARTLSPDLWETKDSSEVTRLRPGHTEAESGFLTRKRATE